MRKILPLLLFFVLSGMMCEQGDNLLAGLNFTPLTPPTNLMSPGAVLAVEEEVVNGVKQEKFHMVCGPRASLSQTLLVMRSATLSQAIKKRQNSSWKLDSAVLEGMGLGISTDKIKSVTATMSNAAVLSISDADVLENLPNRSEPCKAAIRQRLAQGYTLTMVASSLVADMMYVVEWKDEAKSTLSAKDKIIEMQKLSANLGGGLSRVGQSKIESKQLALGIRTDAFLLALTVPGLETWTDTVAERAASEKDTSRAPARADVSSPDAPYVLPAGNTYVTPSVDWDE